MEEQRMWPAKSLVALQAQIDGYIQSGDKKGGRVGMTDAWWGKAREGEVRDSKMWETEREGGSQTSTKGKWEGDEYASEWGINAK